MVGHTLPSALLERVGISKFRIYASANNLYTFTKYSGLDPEIGTRGTLEIGIDRGFPITTDLQPGHQRYPDEKHRISFNIGPRGHVGFCADCHGMFKFWTEIHTSGALLETTKQLRTEAATVLLRSASSGISDGHLPLVLR